MVMVPRSVGAALQIQVAPLAAPSSYFAYFYRPIKWPFTSASASCLRHYIKSKTNTTGLFTLCPADATRLISPDFGRGCSAIKALRDVHINFATRLGTSRTTFVCAFVIKCAVGGLFFDTDKVPRA